MKHKLLKFAICLLTIGIIGAIYAGTQSKISINQMTSADWQQANITSIGEATEEKILSSAPYSHIEDVSEVNGVGEVKQKAIERHFTTRDTCRYEDFILCAVSSFALIVIGALLIIYWFARRKSTAETLTELIKKR